MKFYRHYLVNSLSFLALLHDVVMSAIAWGSAFLLRFNFNIPASFMSVFWTLLPVIISIQLVFFLAFGLYRGLWRFASLPDLKRIIKAVGFSTLALIVISLLIRPSIIVPKIVLILNPILLMVLMSGSRFAYRAWKEQRLFGASLKQGKPVVLLGAGEDAIALMKELARSQDWRVVALLDDNTALLGREFLHVRVKGTFAQLPEIASRYNCQHCILAMPAASHATKRQLTQIANAAHLEVLTIPTVVDMMSGKVSISQIRKIDVEDLLGRDVVQLDNHGLSALITNQSVLVSGAAGSIGSELCRQLLLFKPKQLILLDISEYSLYLLQQEFAAINSKTQLVYLVADVKNQHRISTILKQFQPQLVFHAAAYKHVPLMEDGNVTEAIFNNAYGTYQLALACQQAKVNKFVLISTDKAVNPTNVMGASKRLAELICQSLQDSKQLTQFITVRFGNVLGSSGSVIPKFRAQIAAGGPLTITHPDITRYFMSIPEAAQLVLQAGLMGNGGEVFVLEMGEPVKIVDLANDMIRLSGLQPEDIKIQFTGLRPGEKLYEELLANDENTLPTSHDKLRIAQARSVDTQWLTAVLTWLQSTPTLTETQIKQQLAHWVEEYQPEIKPLFTHSSTVTESLTIH